MANGLLDYYRELWKRREQNPDHPMFQGVAPLGTPAEFELKYGDYQQVPEYSPDNPPAFPVPSLKPPIPSKVSTSLLDDPVGTEAEFTHPIAKESGDPSWYKRSQTMLWASLLGDDKMPRTIRSGRKLAQHDPVTPGLDVAQFAPTNLPYDKGIQSLSSQEKSWREGDEEEDLYSLLRGLV